MKSSFPCFPAWRREATRKGVDPLQDYVINSIRHILSSVTFANLGLWIAFGDEIVRQVQYAAAASELEESGLISRGFLGIRLTK